MNSSQDPVRVPSCRFSSAQTSDTSPWRPTDKPVFVEEIVRDISGALRDLDVPHSVSVRNLESIHDHDAVAVPTFLPSQTGGD